MFTGLVQHLGAVSTAITTPAGCRLVIDTAGWSHRPSPGDSIAVNGCCLTVTDPIQLGLLAFDVVTQTLTTTNLGSLVPGARVNLEHAVTPTTLLGGHIVQGHVEGVAVIRAVAAREEDWRITVEPPEPLFSAIIEKGSVALDGVSLTIARVATPVFEVALIPTTLERTTLGTAAPQQMLNLETDYVARTVVEWLGRYGPGRDSQA